jgi:transcriptional regulator with XRE-family HTH domain
MSNVDASGLAASLRKARRARRLSLRDLADQIGVSFNTLSRVERGFWPDLKNYQAIVGWLELPASTFLGPLESASTPDVITKHLFSDPLLSAEGAEEIATLVQRMYSKLAEPVPAYAVHMRSAGTFVPAAGNALGQMIENMHSALVAEDS